MADREWIKRIVETKGRPCPLMGKKCPGKQEGCAFWLTELIQNGREQAIQPGCLIAFQYVMSSGIQLEMARLQASMDKMATETRDAGRVIGSAILTRRIDSNLAPAELEAPEP